MADRPNDLDALNVWGDPRLLWLFISHVHTQRSLAGALKVHLARYGITAFVAHDDIAPTRVWEDQIIAALQTCHALVVLVSEDVRRSEWVDQEIGWALGRSVLVVSVAVDHAPYGFAVRLHRQVPGDPRARSFPRRPRRIGVSGLARQPPHGGDRR